MYADCKVLGKGGFLSAMQPCRVNLESEIGQFGLSVRPGGASQSPGSLMTYDSGCEAVCRFFFFRGLSRRLKSTVRRHELNEDSVRWQRGTSLMQSLKPKASPRLTYQRYLDQGPSTRPRGIRSRLRERERSIYVYIYTNVYRYVYIYIYIYVITERERQRERESEEATTQRVRKAFPLKMWK